MGRMIDNLSFVFESEDASEEKRLFDNGCVYFAKQANSEFHGFIFTDDNIEKIELPRFFKKEHLPSELRLSVERGHKTLTRFIELCLSEIALKSNITADLMNPYSLYKEVAVSENAGTLLSDEELTPAVSAFKKGKTYKALMNTNFTKVFEEFDVDAGKLFFSKLEKEITQSFGEEVSYDLLDFSIKLHSKLDSVPDVMFAYSILMLALKTSLKISCRLLYRAIYGLDLFVLNNDNVINIEKNISTVVSDFYKIFAQGINIDASRSEMGSILLIDCDMPYGVHLHEFGILVAQTSKWASEFGETAKYSIVTVNEELIPIHHLVDKVLEAGLPIINTN